MAVPTPDEITAVLSQDIFSIKKLGSGISRADGARLPANYPVEDHFNSPRLLQLQDIQWMAWAVYDGHNGPQCARHLEATLLIRLEIDLKKLEPASRSEAVVKQTITHCFQQVDDEIINTYLQTARDPSIRLTTKMKNMQVAVTGSCALVVLYDPVAATIYTACVGDSRAVLGQQMSNNDWEDVPLSVDQGSKNKDELTRVEQEHPGETPTTNDRVLGMAVTRAFGDFGWKSSHEDQSELGKRFQTHGAKEADSIRTPPYLTAEPVVTVHKIQQPSFLVIGTDGLWDLCESSEVVDLVVMWMEAQPGAKESMRISPDEVWWKTSKYKAPEWEPGFDFLARWHEFDTRYTLHKMILVDLDNVAVHLLRNACGGNHTELLEAKVLTEPPNLRNVRDDITVQVVFFDVEEQKS